jgi:hypothetical protein
VAGVYNLLWGLLVVAFPGRSLDLLGLPSDANRPLIQCIGMIVGVYGIGYGIAASDPVRHWPIVLVGLLGKLLGPIGGVWAAATGQMPAAILWLNLLNDLIWWAPFTWILWAVHRGGLPSAVLTPTHATDRSDARSLYQRLLGPAFEQLDPQLRHFHGAATPIEVRGHFAVRRGRGMLRNWIADRAGFPREVEGIPVHLRVEPGPGREAWFRSFGGTPLRSVQKADCGLLSERLGAITLYLQPHVVAGSLEIRSVRSALLGFPLPPLLTPFVFARGYDTAGGMNILVRLELLPLGLLVEYKGIVKVAEGTMGTIGMTSTEGQPQEG